MSERIEATYVLETADDPARAAAIIAGEQSSGTFVALAGETADLKERAGARVEALDVIVKRRGRACPARWPGSSTGAASCACQPAASVERIAVASGSCSPATGGQIDWAAASGFQPIRIAGARLVVGGNEAKAEIGRAADAALAALGEGRDPIVFSAHGPADPAIGEAAAAAAARGLKRPEATRLIGGGLAAVMERILDVAPLRRIAVAGGDTSGDVASALDLFALTASAPLAPGSPLSRGWSDRPKRSGLELALKGGQVGAPSFFGAVKAGAAIA